MMSGIDHSTGPSSNAGGSQSLNQTQH